MKKNKEKFMELVSEQRIDTIEKIKWRVDNRPWLRVSQSIALDILEKLEVLGWTQKYLAEQLGVSPQYVNKLVKGNENLTLETLVKLQNVLDLPIFAISYRPQSSKNEATIPVSVVEISA
jgi:DNA-binding XRE family transcriptional regulator